VVHGILLWFELELGGTWLGTGPLAPPSVWQQTLFPLATPIALAAGAPIEVALQAAPLGEILVWRWSVASGGRRSEANSLDGTPLRAEALALSRGDHVPAAAVELEIDRAILDAVDGRRSIAELAALLRGRFAARFSDDDSAARRVAQVLARYT
ncbi:MAG: hypothetical protein ACXVCV_18910, partial [Polyangia bacterium]